MGDIDSNFQYIYNFVETICKQCGPRHSCSEAEKNANLWISEELNKYCDETFIDEFETHPNLYPQGLIKVAGVFIAISFIFMPFQFPLPIFSAIFVFLGLFVLYTELFMMKEWIKFLFKKGTSSNVFGIIKPTGDIKFRMVFEGHTDSAKEMRIASYKNRRRLKTVLGLYFIIHTIVFSISKFIAQILLGPSLTMVEWGIISWTLIDFFYFIPFLVTYPFCIWVITGFLGKTVVMGANDNLVGSAISACIGKYLSNNRPKNVEVWVGSQGSEEVGDKGARTFVEKYGKKGILDNAYAIVLDSCGAGEEISLIEKDFHKAIYSQEVNDLIKKAHEMVKKENPNISNYTLRRLRIGATDACRYIHEGFKAASIGASEKGKSKPPNWHSTQDIPENLEKKIIVEVFQICLKMIEIVDNQFN